MLGKKLENVFYGIIDELVCFVYHIFRNKSRIIPHETIPLWKQDSTWLEFPVTNIDKWFASCRMLQTRPTGNCRDVTDDANVMTWRMLVSRLVTLLNSRYSVSQQDPLPSRIGEHRSDLGGRLWISQPITEHTWMRPCCQTRSDRQLITSSLRVTWYICKVIYG